MGRKRAAIDDTVTSAAGSSADTVDSPVVAATAGRGTIVSVAKLDGESVAQRVLLSSTHNVVEAWRLVRRLGLPKTSVKDKLPYWKSTEEDGWEDGVFLQPYMKAAMLANKSERTYRADTADRRKPRFRTHSPGLPEVFAANVLLIWVCIHAKI